MLEKILDPLGMDGGRRARDPRSFAQKCGLLHIAFNEMDLPPAASAHTR